MKLKDLSLIGFGLSALLILPTSLAEAATCYKYDSPMLDKTVGYCVDRSTPNAAWNANEPVAYFMHGTNGSAQTWFKNNYANSLEQLRESGETLPAMTFVSFDTEAYSFFIDKPGDPHKAYESWFIKEFIPYIESNFPVCRERACRATIGESMGGFGALKTALRYPDLFVATAVNSPALPPFDIWASMWDWDTFFAHHLVGPIIGQWLIHKVRHSMPTEADWQAHDPIHLTQNYPLNSEAYPPIYFDMGGRDKYGFDVGYKILKQVLDDRKIPYSTNFEPTAGHDMWKRHAIDSLRFLMNHVAGGSLTAQATGSTAVSSQ